MMARTARSNADPVLADQGGREMRGDPIDPAKQEIVRRRAYELYERRGKKPGYDLQDWLEAEEQLRADALDTQLTTTVRA